MDNNSKYRKLDTDVNTTIRTNTGSSMYENDDMDIMEAEAHQKSMQAKRASQARGHAGRGTARNRRQIQIYTIIIIVEVLVLIGIWVTYGIYSSKSGSSSSSSKKSSQESSSGDTINVDNDNFTLTCTKVSISTDTNGAPVALIYFTFVNKTDNPLSMAQVFAPSITQNGGNLDMSNSLVDTPAEIGNKDVQISSGDSLECAYAFTLSDSTSELTITMHDNYETFSDIGSVTVPIS